MDSKATLSRRPPDEVDWERLDKTKLYVYGVGMFSGVTTVLFPLSVIKTQQMASDSVSPGLRGAREVATRIATRDGITGFYKGFSTIIFGSIPSRVIYLTTLEVVKSVVAPRLEEAHFSAAASAAGASFIAGGAASLCTQSVVVPMDVVSSRQMVAGVATSSATSAAAAASPSVAAAAAATASASTSASTSAAGSGSASASGAAAMHTAQSPSARVSGIAMARHIIRTEGVRGLYRGLGASVIMYAPSNALWWAAYGAYQRIIWDAIEGSALGLGTATAGEHAHDTNAVIGVQTASAVLAGATSSAVSTPLDVIKTRLQVSGADGAGPSGKQPTSMLAMAKDIMATDGIRGLWRGVVPRTFNVALWGTAMVSTYELLKRMCKLPDPAEDALEG